MKPTPTLLIASILALTLAPATRAAEVYWGGGADNITANNWYPTAALTPPTATLASSNTVNIASGTVSIINTATVYDTNIGLASGNNAAVIVSGTWNNTGGELSIGNGTGSVGALSIIGSGSVRASTFYVGNYGSGNFHLAQGARLTNSANAFHGRNTGGYGTATIDGFWTIKGSSASNGNLTVGSAAGSKNNLLTIGTTGTVIASPNTASSNYIYIGNAINTSGTVIVNGLLRIDGVNAINSIAYRGNNGTAADSGASGVLIIAQTGTVIFSGTETSLGHLGMGSGDSYRANSTGTAFVDGVWKNAGNLLVGRSGAGYLEIKRTGAVSVGTHLSIAVYNSGSNGNGKATGPEGGTLIVDGLLTIGDHAIIGSGVATAKLHITENGTLRTGTNGNGEGYLQVGRNGSTVGTGSATPVPGTSTMQVDGLLDIGGNFNFGMRNKTELTLGAEGNILVAGSHYQSPQTLLAFTPGSTRDLPLVATAGSAYISGTLKITNINTLAGYASAASAANSSALPFITVVSTGAGIEGDFKTIAITPALTGTTGLPDYIYNGKTILENAGSAATEYRVGQLLAWHAPAANAHGTFTIGAGNTFTLDTPLGDRASASSLTTGWDGRSLTKRGPGTLVIAAVGTRTGDTVIESGTLRIATNAIALGNLVNNAVLDLGGSSADYHTIEAATLAGSGTLILAIETAAATDGGDKLIIRGDASGAHTVLVSVNGAAPVAANPGQIAAVVTVTGNNGATFDGSGAPITPIVTFSTQGGTVTPAQQTVTPGSAYGELPTPVLANATFAGWFTTPSGGSPVTASTIVASDAASHILYARWIAGNHPVITPSAGKDLYGSIIDDTGAPVPNVVVSDGFQCVKTDANGIYQMTRNAKARVVFYSTPETHAVNTLGAGKTGYAWFSQKLTPGINRYNFDLVKLPAPETDFILLGIGDPQVTSLAQLKRFETETIADIDKLRQATPASQPIYGIMLGDIVGDNLHLHAPLRDIVNASPITYFSVLGNHDQNQAYSKLNKDYEAGEDYENIYGPLNYSVNIGNTHIIGLDDVLYTAQSGYSTGLTNDILEWVRQDLSHVPKTKTIIVAYHIPLRGGTYQNAQALFNLLKDYADVHFLAGHTHYQQNITFTISGSTKDITAYEHIHGGACGAWWNSIVNTDGAPNGYGVYTISGTQLTDWYSKPTGYSDTYQMRMYRGNASFGGSYGTYTYGRNANDVVVDIWNSDTTGKWKFAVYEDGVKVSDSLTKLSMRTDAYAAGYHVGILGRTYDSSSNNHLYYHTLKNAAASVEIRATDPFGKTYSLSEFTTDLSEFPATFASPEITAHPSDTTVTVGESVTFTAAVTGTPAPSLKWQTSGDGATWTDVSDATSATYTFTATTTALDGAQYRLAATNIRGLATSAPVTLTVNPDPAFTAAQTLKTQLEAPGTATITVTGSVNLALVGGATVAKGKTIVGADATSTISGGLTLAAGASDTIIRGVNFTNGALTINGANDVDIAHCTFTDAPVSITGDSDNIAFSWNKFTATPAGTGSAMIISDAGAATGILLAHNLWGAGLKSDMPAVTNARVLMFNNYITATGNTTATISGAGAQILSVRNTYEGTHNPITKQSIGRLRTIDNDTATTTGTTAPGEDNVFVPAYSHVINPADAATITSITAHAGNTAGKNSITPSQTNGAASISATVIGEGASTTANSAHVPELGGFTLTANATDFTPSAWQWHLDNFAIPGATSDTYTITNADTATHAGAYAVALTAGADEIVNSGAFTVTVGAPAAPVITTQPVSEAVDIGGSAIFTVVATGNNLTYQWRKNGTPIPNAIGASYTITNAQQSQAGSYTVIVTNDIGSVTSNAATLTVNANCTVSGSHWAITGSTLYATTYTNTANGNFYDTTWTAAQALGVGQTDDTTTFTIAGDGTLTTIGLVTLGEQAGSAGTIVVESGGVWDFTGAAVQVTNTLTNISTSATSTSSVNINTALEIGSQGSGLLTIASGGTVSGTGMITLGVHAGATGTILVDGYLKTTNDLQLGGYFPTNGPSGGNGTVIVNSSGTLIAGNIRVAYGDSLNATGTLIVNTGGYANGAYLIVGHWGQGDFHLANSGTFFSNSYIAFGQGDDSANRLGGVGTGLIEGHAIATSYFNVGGSGIGRVEIARTATVDIGTYSRIGNNATASGTLAIEGKYNVGTYMYVGNTGTGHLHVESSGSLVVAGQFSVGHDLGSSGTAVIDGYVSSGLFAVGYQRQTSGTTAQAATGALYLNSSGTIISNGEVGIGHLGPGSGTAVTGASGTAWVDGYWKSNGVFSVGRSGTGVLYLSTSGTIINDGVGNVGTHYSTNGAGSGVSSGTAFVDGVWQVGSHFMVGANGHGYLYLGTSGTITAVANVVFGNGANSKSTAVIAGHLSGGGNVIVGNAGVASVDLKATSFVTGGGSYSQNANSALFVELGATRVPDIVDASLAAPLISVTGIATLSGTLHAYGDAIQNIPEFEYDVNNYARASSLIGIPVLRAAGGITGDFGIIVVEGLIIPVNLPDFVLPGGYKVSEGDAGATRYDLGYGLAWNSAASMAHGDFTIDPGASLEVDVQLANRTGLTFASGWDGKSLAKKGVGTLILSEANTFTGTLNITSGTVRLGGPAAHTHGDLVNNGWLDFNSPAAGPYRTLTVNSLAGSGTLSMTVNPSGGAGDRLVILGAASGAQSFNLTLSGSAGPWPLDSDALEGLVVVQGTNTATFAGSFNYGSYSYTVQKGTDGAILLGGDAIVGGAAPSITTDPADQAVVAGENASFTIAATGNPAPTYQWQSAPAGGNTWTDISSETSATLTLSTVTLAMDGTQYRCVATNYRGDATSAAATLTVNYAPTITTPPDNQTVTAGDNATFTVAATGNPAPTYQWQSSSNGSTWDDISDETDATLTLTAVTAGMHGMQYRCVATNLVDSATSSAATLTVNQAPVFTTQPGGQSVIEGQNATFTIAVTGNPTPTLQWQSLPVGGSWAPISGETSPTLTITIVTTAQNGTQYRCVASNGISPDATSTAATLTVTSQAVADAQALKELLEAPGTATVTVNGTVDLSLVGGATLAPGKTIVGADATSTIAGGLTIPENASGTVIIGVNFTGGALTINGANDVEVTHCTFTDTPVAITGGADNITFSWNEFTATTGGSGSAMTISNAGANTGILLHNNLWGDGLENDMPVVTNAQVYMYNNYFSATGNTTATVAGEGAEILSVNNIYEGTHNPLTTQSTGKLNASGNDTTTTTGTTAPGDDEVFVPAYSHVINPTDAVTITSITANAGNTAGQSSATPATFSGTASISATVSGAGSGTTSVSAHVPALGGFILTANASGFTPAARQWYLDNFAIAGATSGTYVVTNANAAAHAGVYAVALTASTGEIVTSGAFTVTVGALAAPVITTQPASKTITVGGSATFTVAATGDSLTYQWRKNGSPITGKTSASLTITNAQTADAGSYTVVVTNPAGSKTSNAATLTVNAANTDSGGGGGGGAPSLFLLPALALLFALNRRKNTV